MKVTASKKGVTIFGKTYKVFNSFKNIVVLGLLTKLTRSRDLNKNKLVKSLKSQFDKEL